MRALLLLIALLTAMSFAADNDTTLLKVGTEAPSFSLPGMDGNREALSVWCGQPLAKPYVNAVPHTVVLSFWATYCKPCITEMPQLMKFAAKHRSDPVKVITISIDKEGIAKVAPFLKQHNIDLSVLLDPYAKTAERYGVASVPALFVIGPDRVIRYAAKGFTEGTDIVAKLDKVLADINAGGAAKQPKTPPAAPESARVSPPAKTAATPLSPPPPPAVVQESTLLAPGTEAPTFSLPTLEGTREALSVWCGAMSKPHANTIPHVVILSFWATYCQPCKKEIPALAKFIDGYGDKPIKAFLVSIDKEGQSKVAPFVKQQKFTLPSLLDPYAKTAERYGVKSVPALFVIDTKGIIRYSAMGFDENADFSARLKQVMDEIFSGTKPTASKSVVIGEQVGVQKHAAGGRGEIDPRTVTPRDRWQAIVRVECGQSVEEVADELSVSPEVIKEWYQQLKGAVLKMWDEGAK